MGRQDWDKDAFVDAAIINRLYGKGQQAFWQQAYTQTVRWLKVAVGVSGGQEPTLRHIANILTDKTRLAALVSACRPLALGSAEDSNTGIEPKDQRAMIEKAREVVRWYDEDWLALDEKLRTMITEGIALATTSRARVRSKANQGRTEYIADRNGCWDDWITTELPPAMREAITNARAELAGASETGEGPGTAGEDASNPGNKTAWQHTTLSEMAGAMKHIEKESHEVGAMVQGEITRRAAGGEPNTALENALLTRTRKTGTSMIAAGTAMITVAGAMAPEEVLDWTRVSREL